MEIWKDVPDQAFTSSEKFACGGTTDSPALQRRVMSKQSHDRRLLLPATLIKKSRAFGNSEGYVASLYHVYRGSSKGVSYTHAKRQARLLAY